MLINLILKPKQTRSVVKKLGWPDLNSTVIIKTGFFVLKNKMNKMTKLPKCTPICVISRQSCIILIIYKLAI